MHGSGVALDVDAGFFFEFVDEEIDYGVVKIFTPEVGIAVGGHDFKNAVAELEDGDVKSTTTEVENDDFFVLFGLEAVGQGSGGRLVDDALNLEAGDFASIFGGLALRIIEIGWYSNDGFGDWLAEESLGVGFDFAEDHGGDFLWSVFFAIHFDSYAVALFDDFVRADFFVVGDFFVGKFAADEALDAINGILRIGDALALGDFADQSLAFFGDGDYGWGSAVALSVGNYLWFAGYHVGKSAVGST